MSVVLPLDDLVTETIVRDEQVIFVSEPGCGMFLHRHLSTSTDCTIVARGDQTVRGVAMTLS